MSAKDHSRTSPQAGKCWRLWVLAAAVWTMFIWSNSLRPAAQSAAQSGAVMDLLAPLLSLTGLKEEVWHTLIRKGAHMTEFALLGVCWTKLLEHSPDLRRSALRYAAAVGLCMLTALVDETIQAFVPGRGSLVADVWIDTGGALIGAGLTGMAGFLLRRRNQNKK